MPNFGIDSSLLPATPRDPWREQLTLLLDSTGDGMFGIDLTGICTFINRAGAGMLWLLRRAKIWAQHACADSSQSS